MPAWLPTRSAAPGCRGGGRGLVLPAVLLPLVLAAAIVPAEARHRARLDPAEPIFTERPFIESDLELDLGWEKESGSSLLEPSLGNTWVLWERLETEVEIPVGVRIPDEGATVASLSDVAFGLQLLLCCGPDGLLDYLSLRAEVEAPTGSRSKDVGGTGSFSFSVLPGRLFTVVDALPDLFVQVQLSYQQEIRLSADELATAAALGRPQVHEKDFVWNLAFTQTYLDGRARPVFEVLGTTVVDAVDPGDEGTIVELAGGVWTAPFHDDHWLSPVSIGFGCRWPVTQRREALLATLLIVEWALE